VYSTSARTFPPYTGAAISDGPASAGCVSAKALGPSHRAPGPEPFRNRNGFSGPGWVRASASGDCRVLSHCTRDSMLHCTNIRYGGITKCIGSDYANLSGPGRCRLVRESRLFPWTRGACKSRRSDCPSPGLTVTASILVLPLRALRRGASQLLRHRTSVHWGSRSHFPVGSHCWHGLPGPAHGASVPIT